MSLMFVACANLRSLDLRSFNTESVTEMWSMFENCEALTDLNLSSFNTSNVTSMSYMFEDCKSLKEIDLSSFNTSNVIDMTQMFGACQLLERIYVSNMWNTEKIKVFEMDGEKRNLSMFNDCKSIVGGNGTVWDENHTGYTYAHIDGGASNPGYLTYKVAGGHSDKKCATPTIAFVNGKLTFSCETEDVEFTYEVTNADVKKGNGNEVEIGGTYKVSVYATKEGYDDSGVATLEFTLSADGEVCDVNKDGAVNVADIATIIDKMASQARMQ